MNKLNEIVSYVLSFKPYVMLPMVIFVIAVIFRIKATRAAKSALTIGIGFIGIFIIFDYFVSNIGPAVKAFLDKTGLHFETLDVGWTPMAAISWSYQLVPILLILIVAVNGVMVFFKLTKTVNIDIWNYWHFIFLGAIVREITGSTFFAIAATLILSIITLKLADWTAADVEKFSGLKGIAISTFSGVVYYPIGVVGDKLLSRIPYISNIQANPESIKRKLGIMGEPMVLGFILGIILGIGAGYEIKTVLELAFSIAAVIYILPLMCSILGEGLMAISEEIRGYMSEKHPDMEKNYIGLDMAVIMGNPAVIVTGLLLMPVALVLAFLTPGVNFIPLGDLANMMALAAMVIVATRGNIVRAFIICIPIIIGKLIIASQMAALYTKLSHQANLTFQGYDGMITSFLDGGNIIRFWFLKLFQGNLWAIGCIPIVVYFLWAARLRANNEEQVVQKTNEENTCV